MIDILGWSLYLAIVLTIVAIIVGRLPVAS